MQIVAILLRPQSVSKILWVAHEKLMKFAITPIIGTSLFQHLKFCQNNLGPTAETSCSVVKQQRVALWGNVGFDMQPFECRPQLMKYAALIWEITLWSHNTYYRAEGHNT